jgi:uncharacterized NAD(P)/FAD-binding protein YdhS
MNKILIIGGGLSGTLLALNFIRKSISALEVIILEKNIDFINRGIAYQTMFDLQPLNVPVSKMSLYSDKPNHFFDWLGSKKEHYNSILPEFEGGTFVPRRIYGDYIESVFKEEVKNNNNVKIIVKHESALNIVQIDNKLKVETTNDSYLVDDVVIAIGNFPPSDIPAITKFSLTNHPSYKSNPWQTNIFEKIDTNSNVLIIGAGLTMLDMLIKLNNLGHKGKILVISRNGFIPQKHNIVKPYVLQFPEFMPKDLIAVNRWFRNEIKKAKADGYDWRAVIDALRDKTSEIWANFSEFDKELFLKKLRPFWEVHRHRMPQKTSDLVEKLIKEGQLEIKAAEITHIQSNEESLCVSYQDKKSKANLQFDTDLILNCTGPENNLRKINNPLVINLVEKGLIVPDIFNLGIKNGEKGHIINKENNEITNIYTIGSLRKGRLWESTALKELREQAEEIATDIISKNY